LVVVYGNRFFVSFSIRFMVLRLSTLFDMNPLWCELTMWVRKWMKKWYDILRSPRKKVRYL
jgi:hypothetical protein